MDLNTQGLKAMIPELYSADHFEPISLWDAGWVFAIFAVDRFEKPRADGAISVAATQRAQAQTTLFWAEQLMQAVGKERIRGHPYVEGFVYTSNSSEMKSYADWCVRPFEMARCLHRTPPAEADFDYSDWRFISRRLALALPNANGELTPIYDPICCDFERDLFLDRLQQSKL